MIRNKVLATVLALAAILGPMVATPSGAQDLTGKNDISVTVLDWYSDMTYLNNTYNVSFRVSFDTNSDGTYEEIYTSGTYVNASSLAKPFEAHAYVHNSTPSIEFMVEVLETDLTTQVVNGSGPVHTVLNEENSTGSWAYNNINSSDATKNSYFIYYAYQVSPVYQPNLMNAQTNGWNGTTNTIDILSLIWGGVAVAAIAVTAALVIVIWRGRRRSPPRA